MLLCPYDFYHRRDGEAMGQVFRFLGMTVGVVQSYQKENQRKVNIKQASHPSFMHLFIRLMLFTRVRQTLRHNRTHMPAI